MSSEAPTEADIIAGHCLASRTRALNRVITGIYNDALRSFGISGSQLDILVMAAKLDEASPSRLCRALTLDPSTLSRNTKRLRAKGWLEILPATDGRTQPFTVTREGRAMIERAFPAWRGAQEKARGVLGREGTVFLSGLTPSGKTDGKTDGEMTAERDAEAGIATAG